LIMSFRPYKRAAEKPHCHISNHTSTTVVLINTMQPAPPKAVAVAHCARTARSVRGRRTLAGGSTEPHGGDGRGALSQGRGGG